MRQERGNVAVARPLTPTTTTAKPKKQSRFKGLTTSEKLMYLGSVIVCVALAVLVISRFAMTTEINLAIQETEREIQEAKEVNLQLETEKKKLESVERIRQYAEKKGLQLINTTSISSMDHLESKP